MNRPEQKHQREGLGRHSSQAAIGLGYQFIAAIIIFVGCGYYADAKTGGGHVYTLIGVALTFIYGGYEVWKLVRMMEQENKDAESGRTGDEHAPPK